MTAVGFAGCSLPSYDRALWALRSWLDSWSGLGHAAVGMHRQGFDLQLTQYDERGWRATFYTTWMGHSPTSATGTGWERTPVARGAAGGVGRRLQMGSTNSARLRAIVSRVWRMRSSLLARVERSCSRTAGRLIRLSGLLTRCGGALVRPFMRRSLSTIRCPLRSMQMRLRSTVSTALRHSVLTFDRTVSSSAAGARGR